MVCLTVFSFIHQAAEFEARRAFDAAKKAESALAQLLESIRLSAVSRRQGLPF
jgi:hypothetical protein